MLTEFQQSMYNLSCPLFMKLRMNWMFLKIPQKDPLVEAISYGFVGLQIVSFGIDSIWQGVLTFFFMHANMHLWGI